MQLRGPQRAIFYIAAYGQNVTLCSLIFSQATRSINEIERQFKWNSIDSVVAF